MKKAWEARALRGKTRWVLSALTVAALAACGGGGDGGGRAIPGLAASTALAQRCVAPRSTDALGTVTDENKWVQAWNNETYLWYSEVVDPGPTAYSNPVTYFSTLRTAATTASRPREPFTSVNATRRGADPRVPAWPARRRSH
jgi:hypothetical protein